MFYVLCYTCIFYLFVHTPSPERGPKAKGFRQKYAHSGILGRFRVSFTEIETFQWKSTTRGQGILESIGWI